MKARVAPALNTHSFLLLTRPPPSSPLFLLPPPVRLLSFASCPSTPISSASLAHANTTYLAPHRSIGSIEGFRVRLPDWQSSLAGARQCAGGAGRRGRPHRVHHSPWPGMKGNGGGQRARVRSLRKDPEGLDDCAHLDLVVHARHHLRAVVVNLQLVNFHSQVFADLGADLFRVRSVVESSGAHRATAPGRSRTSGVWKRFRTSSSASFTPEKPPANAIFPESVNAFSLR